MGFDPPVKGPHFDPVAGTPVEDSSALEDPAVLAREILLVAIAEAAREAQPVANDGELSVEIQRLAPVRAEIDHRAQDGFVAGAPQRKISNAGRGKEGVALRRQAHPDRGTAHDAAGEAAMFGNGKPLEANVPGGDGAEAAYIADIVKADPFVADAGAESVAGSPHRILVCALRQSRRRRGEQNGSEAGGP